MCISIHVGIVVIITLFLGLKFWKVPSRKIYAVQQSELLSKGKSRRRRSAINVSSEDSDSDFVNEKKKRSSGGNSLAVIQEFQLLKKEIDTVLTITKSMRFPPGLYLAMSNSFSCNICLDIIHPPVIFARCCKNLLGCESCVDIYYSGENGSLKTCPICRSARAFPETCRVNGLGEFLTSVRPVLYPEPPADSP